MKFLKFFKLLIISILWMCMAHSCTPKKSITRTQTQDTPLVIDSTFTSQSVNEQVFVSTKLSEKDFNKKDLNAWFRQNPAKVYQRNDGILIGDFREHPQAWYYTQIINTSNESQQLVVEEFDKIRCDVFKVFIHRKQKIANVGNIDRSTPFNKYPLPFFTYAVPITVQPKDTIGVLINSQRHYGTHEVNLKIYSYETYLNEEIVNFLSKIFQAVILIICALILFILGRIFSNKVMIYLGIDIVSLLYIHLSTWGVTGTINNFTSIGLSGKNVGSFATFVSCVAVHPFLMEWMKVVPKNEKVFKAISYSLIGFCSFCALCFLLPVRLYDFVYTFIDFPILWLVAVILTLGWIYYCAFLAVFRTKTYYLLIGFGMGFLPMSIQQLSIFFSETPYFLFKTNVPSIVFAALGLSIVSIYLLREQLVTRKKLEENISEVKDTMDNIRKNEVATIGRNLHDNVGNILASALGYLNLRNVNNETVQNLVKDAISEIRFLSHNLVKDDNLPIKVKIERLTEHFNEFSNINYVFTDYSNNKINQLSAEQQTNLYFIIQELFTNTLKHSFALEVILQIFEDNKRIWITIEDDGVGMTNRKIDEGIGLKNIDTRAKLAGFKVITDSSMHGTNTTIELML